MIKLKVRDSDKLKYLITMCGYSNKSLAQSINRAPTYLSGIVHGRYNPGPVTAKKIVDAINKTLKTTYGIDDIFLNLSVKKNATKSV